MSSVPKDRGLASPLVRHPATLPGGRMLERDPAALSSDGYGRRAIERRRGAAALMAAVGAGITLGSEPRAARERLEEELRSTLRARSVILRDEPAPLLAPNTLCFDVPFGHGDRRARLEILLETPRPLDEWSCQVIDAATHLAAMILELERATGRLPTGGARRQPDGAAPLIGSSEAIRRVRERIERVALTDFSVLIEGESGSGKELVARQIHELSRRRRGPFVAVNCAAIVETLLE